MSSSLIANGDFENGTASWSFTSSGSGVNDESETIENKYCAISTTESIYQTIGVLANDYVTVTLNSRGVVSGKVSLMLQNSNTEYWSDVFNSALNAEWKTEIFSFTVSPEWVGPFVIHFQSGYSPTSTDAVDVDNIVVSK